MASLPSAAGLPSNATSAGGNALGGARTAWGIKVEWIGSTSRSSVPGGSSFRRASSLPRPGPYPTHGRQDASDAREQQLHLTTNTSATPLPNVQPASEDVNMDPLLADINRLISSLSLQPTLPMSKVEFTTLDRNLVNLMAKQDDFISNSSFKDVIPDFIDRACKVYHGECDALHKALQTLKSDAALYAQGKCPRPLEHRSGQQFKKELKEEFDLAQKQADDKKAMDDFKRKIEATKQWVALKAQELETLHFISVKLGELHDKMLENQMCMNQNDMLKMRAHVVCVLHAHLPEYMHKAAKKYADQSKNKEDADKKRLDREQKFDELIQMHPKVALAVFFREMEERLISVCLARKDQMEQEYRRVRRGQQLTTLEDQVYNMKPDLQKNGLAYLDSRMTQIFQQSKSKVKGNKVGSGSRTAQNRSSAPQHNNRARNRARSTSKTNRTRNSSKTSQQRGTSASARTRRTKSQISKASQRSARTSSSRGRSSLQQQRSTNRSSKSKQSQNSAKSMTSQRSFSRNTSCSKSNRARQSSRSSNKSKTSRATFT